MGEHFCLKWNNHQENLTGIMTKLLDEQKFVDVSLVCEMKTFKAHQTVLSASSPYFEQVLEENSHPHPIVILRDVKEAEMSALLQYMYRGEVNVRDHELPAFLQIARALQVRGLSENVRKEDVSERETSQPQQPQRVLSESPQNLATPFKRRRVSISDSQTNNDRHSADSQQSLPVALVCKSNSNHYHHSHHHQQQQQHQKPSSNLSAFSYSDNMSDVQFIDRPATPSTPAIKQESDCVSVQSDPSESYHVNHLVHMQPPSHKTSVADVVTDSNLSICAKPLTPSSTTPTASSTTSDALPSKTDFAKPQLVKHAFKKIEGFGYECKICGQIKQHMSNHYLKHFPQHHECHLCGRTYTRKDNFNSHLKRDHMQRVRNGGYRRRRARPSVNLVATAEKPEKTDFGPALNRFFTHDVYSHMKFTMETTLPEAPLGPLGPQVESLDLMTRPATTPLTASPCTPVYDTLPYFYNYLSQLNMEKGLAITHRH